ncbi:hypothetical protein [Natronobacterium gregoryi]|uniref:Uncharacterized protein n=2 Tax=Natronobacterium gregoryi TaxID=44930 RepID=L0AGV0_NATGS|nr:hypothetical protein [Natronobacterium gregoryi]AFZ73103.1 hypothetical protein Natgr_1919 [Natronobacterium gregoryi SP2]ELY70798.1 hypothetical protein C490_05892 [Natronobacterium gregoryi SP2]PLK20378.1 hypothetical protein CYV19_09615 [Natronobacterium gregoryi SP2]SFI61117.1 hypothetical protein SAMN05443661_102162 [Natronobacterium gregoryi]
MGRLSTFILVGIGVLVFGLVILSVIATLAGIAYPMVVTVFSVAISLAVLALFVLALLSLLALLSNGGA